MNRLVVTPESSTGRVESSAQLVSVTVHLRGGQAPMLGTPTACPYLVVVPSVITGHGGVSFDGGFTLVHVPTTRVLPAADMWGLLSPPLARYAAALLTAAGLDWSSNQVRVYATPEYGRAWMDALRVCADLSSEYGDDPELLEESVEHRIAELNRVGGAP